MNSIQPDDYLPLPRDKQYFRTEVLRWLRYWRTAIADPTLLLNESERFSLNVFQLGSQDLLNMFLRLGNVHQEIEKFLVQDEFLRAWGIEKITITKVLKLDTKFPETSTQRYFKAMFSITQILNRPQRVKKIKGHAYGRHAILICSNDDDIHQFEASCNLLKPKLQQRDFEVTILGKGGRPFTCVEEILEYMRGAIKEVSEFTGKNPALFIYIHAHGSFDMSQHYFWPCDRFSLNSCLEDLLASCWDQSNHFAKFALVDSCSPHEYFDLMPPSRPLPRNTVCLFASPPGQIAITGPSYYTKDEIERIPTTLVRSFVASLDDLKLLGQPWEEVVRSTQHLGEYFFCADQTSGKNPVQNPVPVPFFLKANTTREFSLLF